MDSGSLKVKRNARSPVPGRPRSRESCRIAVGGHLAPGGEAETCWSPRARRSVPFHPRPLSAVPSGCVTSCSQQAGSRGVGVAVAEALGSNRFLPRSPEGRWCFYPIQAPGIPQLRRKRPSPPCRVLPGRPPAYTPLRSSSVPEPARPSLSELALS